MGMWVGYRRESQCRGRPTGFSRCDGVLSAGVREWEDTKITPKLGNHVKGMLVMPLTKVRLLEF